MKSERGSERACCATWTWREFKFACGARAAFRPAKQPFARPTCAGLPQSFQGGRLLRGIVRVAWARPFGRARGPTGLSTGLNSARGGFTSARRNTQQVAALWLKLWLATCAPLPLTASLARSLARRPLQASCARRPIEHDGGSAGASASPFAPPPPPPLTRLPGCCLLSGRLDGRTRSAGRRGERQQVAQLAALSLSLSLPLGRFRRRRLCCVAAARECTDLVRSSRAARARPTGRPAALMVGRS